MVRSEVADGRDGLQTWRVATHILNEQSRTADKGWSSSLGVGRGVNSSQQQKKRLVTKCYTGPRILTDTFERPRQWEMDMAKFWSENLRGLSLRSPRHGWEDNIKLDLGEVG